MATKGPAMQTNRTPRQQLQTGQAAQPYAVEAWRDQLVCFLAARHGRQLVQGYVRQRGRYATAAAAQRAADYLNSFHPLHPARVIDTRTDTPC